MFHVVVLAYMYTYIYIIYIVCCYLKAGGFPYGLEVGSSPTQRTSSLPSFGTGPQKRSPSRTWVGFPWGPPKVSLQTGWETVGLENPLLENPREEETDTPRKINGWNLQPSPIFLQEKWIFQPNLQGRTWNPAVNSSRGVSMGFFSRKDPWAECGVGEVEALQEAGLKPTEAASPPGNVTRFFPSETRPTGQVSPTKVSYKFQSKRTHQFLQGFNCYIVSKSMNFITEQ